MKKRLTALFLILILLGSSISLVSADGDQTFSISNPAQLVQKILNTRWTIDAPITVLKATLSQNGHSETVYLIALDGVVFYPNHINGLSACFASEFSLSTPYYREAKQAALSVIPKNAKVLIVGFSLGGMIAQQLAADRDMKNRYEILNTLTCGSPYVISGTKEGSFRRLVGVFDVIPRLSLAPLRTRLQNVRYEMGIPEVSLLNDYHGNVYQNEDVWGKYDCLGIKGGSAVLTVCESDIRFFHEQSILR